MLIVVGPQPFNLPLLVLAISFQFMDSSLKWSLNTHSIQITFKRVNCCSTSRLSRSFSLSRVRIRRKRSWFSARGILWLPRWKEDDRETDCALGWLKSIVKQKNGEVKPFFIRTCTFIIYRQFKLWLLAGNGLVQKVQHGIGAVEGVVRLKDGHLTRAYQVQFELTPIFAVFFHIIFDGLQCLLTIFWMCYDRLGHYKRR